MLNKKRKIIEGHIKTHSVSSDEDRADVFMSQRQHLA